MICGNFDHHFVSNNNLGFVNLDRSFYLTDFTYNKYTSDFLMVKKLTLSDLKIESINKGNVNYKIKR